MGFFQKFRELVGIEDVDEEYEDQEETKSFVPEDKTPDIRPISSVQKPSSALSSAVPAVPARVSQTSRFTNKEMSLGVLSPQSFEESPRIVDNLKAKKPVIINLENLETDVARKIFDFLSGATYALNGNVQKVANNIFVFAPQNVEVTYNNGAKSGDQPAKSPWRQ